MPVEPTPRPWRKDGLITSSVLTGGKQVCRAIVGGRDGEHPTLFIESILFDREDTEQFEANVDLILAAVNQHDKLRFALEAVLAVLDGTSASPTVAMMAELEKLVRRALLGDDPA